jgi:N-ethylmaleimide reductase
MSHALMDLFSPLTLGDLHLANRVVMAPMTRLRAGGAGVPGDLVAEYYAQRAGFGLVVTEGTYPSHESQGYPGQPGITDDEQEAGWRRVTDAVHARGGRIVLQVMHAGRVSHTDITGTDRIVAPSAIAVEGETHGPAGKVPYPVPHELTVAEVQQVVRDHVAAARRAVRAGFDGVEVHAANGYLGHQFLAANTNVRTDAYGGTPAGRAQYVVEVTTAVAEAVGAGRVGLRISPMHHTQDVLEVDELDVRATYGSLVDQLRPLGLAYLSVVHPEPAGDLVQQLRRRAGAPLLVNTGFSAVSTREEAVALVEGAHADAAVVGRPSLANPDLVARWAGRHPENEDRPELWYAGGAEGYTDFPTLESAGR